LIVSIAMPNMLSLHRLQNKKGSSGRLTPICVADQPARTQNWLMTLSRPRTRYPFACALLLAGLFRAMPHAVAAEPLRASPWTPSVNSQARLLAAGGPEPGSPIVYRAGLEIELKGSAHTYWRQPGDAGVPPQISFEGSRNLKSAELRYPAPVRIDENGLQVFGYRRNVILPIDVRPVNPAQPVRLAVRFTYAACDKICIPAEAVTMLDLAPADARGPDAGRLLMAAATLPDRATNGGPVTLTPRVVTGRDKPTWQLTIERPRGPWRDLFVEAPEGWFFETRRSGDGFEITAAEQPKEARGLPPVRLTLTGPRDFEVKLDLPAP
jgi:DsbC/DsbD-like thiol-disulfide interchange protein